MYMILTLNKVWKLLKNIIIWINYMVDLILTMKIQEKNSRNI